jgi:acyl-CoA oxidase
VIAIRYGLSRRQFGPPGEVLVLDYLSHQRRLFPHLAKTFVLQFALNHAKDLFGNQRTKDPKELHLLAAGLKPACTWHRVAVLQECREACGGMGFHASNRIAVMKTDADIDTTWEGDNNVLLQQVATCLMKELRQQLGKEERFSGIMAYYGRQVGLEIRDKNIFKRSYVAEEHLMDFDFFRNAMEYREARLLRALVGKVRRNSSSGVFNAWNESLDIAKELALASIDRQVLEQFIGAVEKADASLKNILHALCSLYALFYGIL